MGKLAWSQLRFRLARTLALVLGIGVAVTAFSVLTAAARTSQLRTIGTVAAHFPSAYDILVRPKGTQTQLERATGTVQPDFLAGIYGGISMRQYHQIQSIPGVQVAAPIAMVGYSLPIEFYPVRVPAAAVAGQGRRLFEAFTTWVSAGGSTRISQPASYVYITPRPIRLDGTAGAAELLPDGKKAITCPQPRRAQGPFSPAIQSQCWSWSRVNGLGPLVSDLPQLTSRHPGLAIEWDFPLLIAAIDPAAEARLDGLNHALTSGRYLGESAGPRVITAPSGGQLTTFPVLASSVSGIGEYAQTIVRELADPRSPPRWNADGTLAGPRGPGRAVLTVRIGAQQAYQQLLERLSGLSKVNRYYPAINEYWTVGPVRYDPGAGGALVPVAVHNRTSVWRSAIEYLGTVRAPMDNADDQYRLLTDHGPRSRSFTSASGALPIPIPALRGVFNPAKVKTFDPLSQVPLSVYRPVSAVPATAASRAALGGSDLLPSLNLGGYVSQPPQLITTLAALPALENSGYFTADLHARDPISVIRVRVAGVTGPDAVSRERIRLVAQEISVRTGLTVDIVAGSSPSPTRIALPAGRFGQPALSLTEDWVRKGVALAIVSAVDRKSLILFVLILVVCALFVANSATAAIRSRRSELAVLACFGWTRLRIFVAVLGELLALGLAAGVIGALVSLPLAAWLGLRASAGHALLAVPAAALLAVVAGAFPAWLASRVSPADALSPAVLPVGRGRSPAGVGRLALVNVLRAPGRALLGAVSLAVGVAALTVLLAVTLAFRGVIVGSLLGAAVAVQVRGVDYVAAVATIALGVLAVADVVFLNVRERAHEYAAIRATGWTERSLARLVVSEGVTIGAVGALLGAGLGLACAAAFAGEVSFRIVLSACGCALTGVLLTAAAALLPVQLLRRLPTARLLAEE